MSKTTERRNSQIKKEYPNFDEFYPDKNPRKEIELKQFTDEQPVNNSQSSSHDDFYTADLIGHNSYDYLNDVQNALGTGK